MDDIHYTTSVSLEYMCSVTNIDKLKKKDLFFWARPGAHCERFMDSKLNTKSDLHHVENRFILWVRFWKKSACYIWKI